MSRLPKSRTISQIVESQLPAFVRDDYPQFIAFLKEYYSWMEKNGADVYTAKILASSPNTITLPDTASSVINAYENMSIVCLNGPTKGHTRFIDYYDPATNTVTVSPSWTPGYVPLPNTNMVIRDTMYPNKLLQYKDIDTTLDQFLQLFADQYLFQIPGTILADQRKVLKHVKQFYQARGNEDSFRYLFRLLFDEEINLYYPKVDLLRTDDAKWLIQYVMVTGTVNSTFDWTSRQVVGVLSGATASVESVLQKYVDGYLITTMYLSNIQGEFGDPQNTNTSEPVKIQYPFVPPPQTDLGSVTDLLEPNTITESELAYLLLSNLPIQDAGENYKVGDPISITGGGALAPASAYVSAVYTTFYNGVCQTPPTTYYLQPFFGANDGTDAEDIDPTQDGVAIPGLYFFDDVQSDITQEELLTPYEILLASTETNVDDFFDGDQISLVGGTGVGQQTTIVSYNGTTKVATVATAFNPVPDGTTQYSILHNSGGIKAITITDFGVGFTSTPTVTITSENGNSAVLPPILGMIGTTAGMWTVGSNGGIGGLPTTPDSMLDSNKVIQDSYYWQDFSYVIQSGTPIDNWRSVVKTLLHPAGMKMFGSVLVISEPETGFLEIGEGTLQINIEEQYFDTAIQVSTEKIITIEPDPVIIGATNIDLDNWKFLEYPPCGDFSLVYPYPNQNYWTANGPGNTQISNFADIMIGTIINNPGTRTKIAMDSYTVMESVSSNGFTTVVGVVGQNLGMLDHSKFYDFPPYPGDPVMYPSPNQNYWNGPGNTQIKDFQNVIIGDVMIDSDTYRTNFCVDSDITMLGSDYGIPAIGNMVEYAFLEGMHPLIVYNVSPNSFTNTLNGVFGTSETTQTDDPTWDMTGIALNASDSQFVTATAVPVCLKQATVVVVVQSSNLSTNQGVANCIQEDADNGYAIDILEDGGLLFRAQYDGTSIAISYPTATLSDNQWFMATLTFDNGVLTGQLNQETPIQTQFSSYPLAPTSNSPGWYLGNGSVDYVTMAQNSSLFDQVLFGTNQYREASSGEVTVSFSFLEGGYAFAIFYDRVLYDFEITSIYKALQATLNTRGITLP